MQKVAGEMISPAPPRYFREFRWGVGRIILPTLS